MQSAFSKVRCLNFDLAAGVLLRAEFGLHRVRFVSCGVEPRWTSDASFLLTYSRNRHSVPLNLLARALAVTSREAAPNVWRTRRIRIGQNTVVRSGSRSLSGIAIDKRARMGCAVLRHSVVPVIYAAAMNYSGISPVHVQPRFSWRALQ
jgi:hypothetical protein